MKKTIGYVRVSSGKQVDNYSIAAQTRIIKEFCAKEKYENVEIIEEPGKTGMNMNRKGLTQVREYIKAGEVARVLVIELSRMNRNVKDLNILIDECEENGVDLIGVMVPIDTKTPEGKLFTNIKGAFDQYDSEQKSVKSRTGLVQKGLQGEYTHGNGVPYGYRKNKKHYLVAVNDEIDIIKKLFNYYVYENLSEKNAADKIYEETGKSFSKKNIYRFLSKPLYRGFTVVDNKKMYPNCKYLDECTEESIKDYMRTKDKPSTIIRPIITESMYEDFISRKKVKGYSKQSYKYRNKVYINGERAQHCKQKKKSGKEYWYYYIHYENQKIHVNQEQIDKALRKHISEIQYEEMAMFSESIRTISLGFANGSLEEEEFIDKLKECRKSYERMAEEVSRVDIRTIGKGYCIEII